MVSSHCYWKIDGIVVLLEETEWYFHVVTGNCIVSSCCYRKLHRIFMLLLETGWYRHVVKGNCMVSSCCYAKLHGIVKFYRKLHGIVMLRFNCAIWKGYGKLHGAQGTKNLQKIIEMWDNALYRVHTETKGSC
jgi:hypothetical protein